MKIRLENVRSAFPVFFTPRAADPAKPNDLSFSGAFIFGPDHPARKAVSDGCVALANETWGTKAPDILKGLVANDRLAIHKGDTKAQYEGYAGNYFINTRNKARPTVLDRNKSPLVEADGKPYAGCFVNVVVELWAQDNKYGKRINASLMGVQFFADGDAFSGGGVADADDFESLEAGADAETALV